jgi:kynurenine formamidase
MKIRIDNRNFQVDFNNPMDISIPLQSGVNNPSCYFSDPPEFNPVINQNFIGSVARGGPCNHRKITITPHGNGTHTECYGHLSPDPEITINKCLTSFHFQAMLVSVRPRGTDQGDQVILWNDVEKLTGGNFSEALIIRTLPNSPSKLTRQYSGTNPPYLEDGFGKALADREVSHLLVDLPSIDKENDDGKLMNHRGFWDYPAHPRKACTITELIFVPDSIADGTYLLNLQISGLESDACPSKPVLFNLKSG